MNMAMHSYGTPLVQQQMLQMQLIGANIGFNPLPPPAYNPQFFSFTGTSLSLQSRLDSLTDQQLDKIIDAKISVTGMEIKPMRPWSYCCTIIWGSIFILPLLLLCCDCWKRCTYAAYDIPATVYSSLGRLLKGLNMRNLTMTVVDNCFDEYKADTLHSVLTQGKLTGFTFINSAGPYDYQGRQYSDFRKNMKAIKSIPNLMSDMRWHQQLVS